MHFGNLGGIVRKRDTGILQLGALEVVSSIRGYTIYKAIWTPIVGEILSAEREPDNIHTVALCAEDLKVGNIPLKLSRLCNSFLTRGGTIYMYKHLSHALNSLLLISLKADSMFHASTFHRSEKLVCRLQCRLNFDVMHLPVIQIIVGAVYMNSLHDENGEVKPLFVNV